MSASTKWIICVGYPNAGKTSTFNQLTHSHYKAVNYPGSTVHYNLAKTKLDTTFVTWIDTPGVVTFSPHSDDEKITHSALTQLNTLDPEAPHHPNLVMYVADGLQLERHLMGFQLLKSQGYPLALIVTRADQLKKLKGHLNLDILQQEVGVPVFYSNARTGAGLPTPKQIQALLDQVLPYTPEHEESTQKWEAASIWAKTVIQKALTPPQFQKDLDHWFLHPILGGLIFITIMTSFFFLIFLGAQPLMEGISTLWQLLIGTLHRLIPDSVGATMLIDGLINNLGAVLVFVPQIFLLFLAMEILEGSGYLARAAIIVDKPLSWLGLTGRSFVPILSGAACAIPAMMATRGLTQKTQRLITLWIIPLMPCSARLPVYGLLLALLFHGKALYSALGMVIIYILSLTLAILIGKLVSLKLKPTTHSFYMEIPRWQLPQWSVILRNSTRNALQFIQRAGPIILIISTFIWILSQYPTPQTSWLAHIGQFISPVFRPMGWDWRIGVAILASFAAREVFVSVLAAMLVLGEHNLAFHLLSTHSPLLNTPAILSLIVFFMISLQCGTTLAVMKKEIGSWTTPLTMATSYLILAYTLAVLTYQIGIRI